jgi:hypothetical protein
MEVKAYAVEATIEASHWWSAGRRRLFARELARLSIPRDGTSTGQQIRMLSHSGVKHVTALT